MEDSGIDSGDKSNSICFNTDIGVNVNQNIIFIESDNSSNDNVEVIFRNPTCVERDQKSVKLNNSNNLNNIINNNNNNNSISNCNNDNKKDDEKPTQINSCKVLQRKLELKVERAKRNYNQLHEDKEPKPNSSTLIPLNRLQFPRCTENIPLVEYKSDNSDDEDEISFFPVKPKQKKQDLSDTFSIQEMTIESDTEDDDSESQNLQLLPPTSGDKIIEKVIRFMCCIGNKNFNTM